MCEVSGGPGTRRLHLSCSSHRSSWAGWAQTAPAVAGGAVGTNLRRLQGQMLSYTLQRALTRRVEQNWRNAGVSPAISAILRCGMGMGTVALLPWVIRKCPEASNGCQNIHFQIPLSLSFTLTATHRALLTDAVGLVDLVPSGSEGRETRLSHPHAPRCICCSPVCSFPRAGGNLAGGRWESAPSSVQVWSSPSRTA